MLYSRELISNTDVATRNWVDKSNSAFTIIWKLYDYIFNVINYSYEDFIVWKFGETHIWWNIFFNKVTSLLEKFKKISQRFHHRWRFINTLFETPCNIILLYIHVSCLLEDHLYWYRNLFSITVNFAPGNSPWCSRYYVVLCTYVVKHYNQAYMCL